MRKVLPQFFIIGLLVSGCSIIQKTPRNELSNGIYTKKAPTYKSKVYVDLVDENIRIYPIAEGEEQQIDAADTCFVYLMELNTVEKIDFSLYQSSVDVDFLTIPLKFRKPTKGVPPQLNTNVNGAIYLGHRTDIFKINYKLNPLLRKATRNINHFGYSLGIFTGLGNTFMSPTNTNFLLDQEYDGVIWSKGVAAIVGINNFTVGLAGGLDRLLDKNRTIWIYNNKPWFGLAFGLNLN